MAKYIDADMLIAAISEQKLMAREPVARRILQMIEDAPTADVKPVKHGQWIVYDCERYAGRQDKLGNPISIPYKEYTCCFCGRITIIHDNYCPNCGAKMDGEDGDDNA